MSTYRVDVYNTSGELQAQIVDYLSLSYIKRVNDVGLLRLELNGEHSLLDILEDKWELEVWRKDSGDYVREITGIFRNIEWSHKEGEPIATLICPDLKHKLTWRIVAWYAGETNRSRFYSQPAETIAKTIVDYNMTSNASVTNGRLREGEVAGISVETDGGGGNSIDAGLSYSMILDALQKIASIGGGDFDLVRVSPTESEFRWYDGQLGEDKTSDVLIAISMGNMGNAEYIEERSGEKTVAIVGGKGEESDRDISVRTGANYSVSNDIEVFVASTDVDAGELNILGDRGDERLDELMARRAFTFDVLQTQGARYKSEYDLGDLVRVLNPYTSQEFSVKIAEVAISFDRNGNEKIQVGVEEQ